MIIIWPHMVPGAPARVHNYWGHDPSLLLRISKSLISCATQFLPPLSSSWIRDQIERKICLKLLATLLLTSLAAPWTTCVVFPASMASQVCSHLMSDQVADINFLVTGIGSWHSGHMHSRNDKATWTSDDLTLVALHEGHPRKPGRMHIHLHGYLGSVIWIN